MKNRKKRYSNKVLYGIQQTIIGFACLGQKIDYVFPVTHARTTKQPAFTLFILEIPH